MVGRRRWIVAVSVVVAAGLPGVARSSVLRVGPPAAIAATAGPGGPPAAAAGPPTTQASQSATVMAVGFTTARLQLTVAPHRQPVVVRLVYGDRHPYGGRSAVHRLRPSRRRFTVQWLLYRLRPATLYHVVFLSVTVSGRAGRAGRAQTRTVAFRTERIGYQNPVFGSFADPELFAADPGRPIFYAYGTGNDFPITVSSDLVHWSGAGTALSGRPAWVSRGRDWHPWAPGVTHVDAPCPGSLTPGCYHMFYVGWNASLRPHVNCVAVATSPTPGGPFTDQGILQSLVPSFDQHGRPPGCGDSAGSGLIDPFPFTDSDGSSYLYVSTDWSCVAPAGAPCHLQPTLSVIPLAPDGLHTLGARRPLLTGRPGTWEAAGLKTPVVENPSVERHGSTYVLLYSGGDWTGAYGMGYALGSSPLGPFVRPGSGPFLAQGAAVGAPGGGSTVIGPHGGEWLVYHGRSPGAATRTLRIDPLWWGSDGRVHTLGPTAGPQAAVP